MVHVSTAYVNSKIHIVDEIVYPPPADVNTVLKLVNELDAATLEAQTPEILKGHANSYTFTKHLAEHEIANGGLPATIIRPSMSGFIYANMYYDFYLPPLYFTLNLIFIYLVMGAWKEPVPGWTISKNGPTGFLMGASKGVLRRLPLSKDIIYDYIPIDVVVNSLIVAAYNVDRDRY